uniref:Uncharacterized protein n=1 Tax=Spongospora subterranea TaxID=70186 RepID=A0A0H5R8E6_9EUKA|eukprot:CRZ04609.1 hypothetical protein [Spongospora subterranea]
MILSAYLQHATNTDLLNINCSTILHASTKHTFATNQALLVTSACLFNSMFFMFVLQPYIRTSKTHTTLSAKQAATLLPSLFQHTSKIPPFPLYVFMIFASFTDHIFKHLSNDPVAKYSLFGLNATE